MNQSELVREVAANCQVSQKDVTKILKGVIGAIQDNVAEGDNVTLVGFGTFKQQTRPSHPGRNPITGETIVVPEKVVPIFKAGAEFKRLVNGDDF